MILGWCFTIACQAQDTVTVNDSWIQAAPPTAKVFAAYMEIVNHGDKPLTLTGISVQGFERAEIHHSTIINNMARMNKVDTLTIAPGTTQPFKPGGYHIMLINPSHSLAPGDKLTLQLNFAGLQKSAVFMVKRAPSGQPQHHHHHHH